jgi:hypothetical protein
MKSQAPSSKYQDFILLAEFCEQRGPVTLLTIPFKRKEFEDFDFNSFVRRILSSDHTRKNDPSGSNSGLFGTEDTVVYLRDSAQKAHAYVNIHSLLCICFLSIWDLNSKILENIYRFTT